MSQHPRFSEMNLVWVDMEMSGLNPDSDRVLEVAVVVTDASLDIIDEGPVLVVHQNARVIDGMDRWNSATHARSGLIDKVRASALDEEHASDKLTEFLRSLVPRGKSPMCGNSICQDRRFMHRMMPRLERYFHYRSIDVSTVKELARRWAPEVSRGFSKDSAHTALSDVRDSIDELRYYRPFMGQLAGTLEAP